MQARDPKHFARRLIQGDEGHGPRIVDLGKPDEKGVAEVFHRAKEAEAQIFRRYFRKKRRVERFVVWADRPDINRPSIRQGDMAIPLVGVIGMATFPPQASLANGVMRPAASSPVSDTVKVRQALEYFDGL